MQSVNGKTKNNTTSLNYKGYFDQATNTISYLIWDKSSLEAAIIDPVYEIDMVTGATDSQPTDQIIEMAADKNLKIKYILETHAHADHLSGAPYLKSKIGAKIAIGANIKKVQNIFRPIFNLENKNDDFDILLGDSETLFLGEMVIEIIPTPGHTPACLSYKVEDNIFVGDTLFMPDFGTARCDFPGGDAGQLFDSIQKILDHPRDTKLFMCHDYLSGDRKEYKWETTVGEQSDTNIHINKTVNRDAFIEMRKKRDAGLKAPKLLLPSIQVNINAGNLPNAESNGVAYLKIPINAL